MTKLTKRQAEVLECVAKRLTLKETAANLGVSESAVNSHIRSIKAQLGANSLSELALYWRKFNEILPEDGYRKPACINSRLAQDELVPAAGARDEAGQVLTFAEPMAFHQSAPWEGLEPDIVPGVLRGINARWIRAIAIIVIALGFLALVMLGLGVGQGINAALSDRSAAPPTHI